MENIWGIIVDDEYKFKKKKCEYCGLKVVHLNRYWSICLDCLIDKLVDKGTIDVSIALCKEMKEERMKNKDNG